MSRWTKIASRTDGDTLVSFVSDTGRKQMVGVTVSLEFMRA
jgi:hypothetical protein